MNSHSAIAADEELFWVDSGMPEKPCKQQTLVFAKKDTATKTA